MPHDHQHSHHPATGSRLLVSLALTCLFVIGEGVAGYLSNSLALISDAGHNLADALALLLSWYALRAAAKPATARRTYGFHRVGILSALANAVTLVVIALFIFWEGIRRLQSPGPVGGGTMMAVAGVAVVLNTAISLLLRHEARHDLNIRSAYLHMAGDALSGLGVVVAGLVVATTGSAIADPIVSILIGVLILWSSWGILAESVDVLLEAAPAGLDMEGLEQAIGRVPGVQGVHDLHVWTIGTSVLACSCHIEVQEQPASGGQQVLGDVIDMLATEYGITHSTVQVEVDDCRVNGNGCAANGHGGCG